MNELAPPLLCAVIIVFGLSLAYSVADSEKEHYQKFVSSCTESGGHIGKKYISSTKKLDGKLVEIQTPVSHRDFSAIKPKNLG